MLRIRSKLNVQQRSVSFEMACTVSQCMLCNAESACKLKEHCALFSVQSPGFAQRQGNNRHISLFECQSGHHDISHDAAVIRSLCCHQISLLGHHKKAYIHHFKVWGRRSIWTYGFWAATNKRTHELINIRCSCSFRQQAMSAVSAISSASMIRVRECRVQWVSGLGMWFHGVQFCNAATYDFLTQELHKKSKACKSQQYY